ncbi:MAG: Gfo/Idh/MocA family oxidoreductase [Planctomycetes bacterium]|nr:Gfo/Idh/MocA family oxidoreductase [Planctomycetota bacterium]
MKTIRFGIIGCGLMGREFASAAARWCHLVDPPARPQIVAVCDTSDRAMDWFARNFPSVAQRTDDYRRLLANGQVDAVYVALPHHLHRQVYLDVIAAGKHLMGEKPFGIDLAANSEINRGIEARPDVFVRCVSQFPFFPAVQRIGRMIESGQFGRIIGVSSGFLHSSDLDADKPINWKRQVDTNGVYGVMADLGMHACHVPLRAGWRPRTVSAVLSKLVPTRPASKGSAQRVPCETWDNATLLIDAVDPAGGSFPWTLRTWRIAPGHRNAWYVEILADRTSVRFDTRSPGSLQVMRYDGGEQNWQTIEAGFETTYPTITGSIFEFGFTDAVQQMWAAFTCELATGRTPGLFAGCVRPEEVAISHRIFDAALRSAAAGMPVDCAPGGPPGR